MSDTPIVVTGASGFIAKHIIAELLRRGYPVRGTLRDPAKADAVRAAIRRAGADPANVSFTTADLLSDRGWDEAVSGAKVVLHTASPFPMTQPDDAEDVIRPAVDGTLCVLKAAARAKVSRLVLTSSTVAILYASGVPRDHVYSEADFTDETSTELTPYIRSKTLAEKAAWKFIAREPAFELVTINPGFVHGPALDDDLSTSHQLFQVMAKGVYPAAPKIRFPVAHVHDVARAHAEAAVRPAAAGQRYLIGSGEMGLFGLGQVMARELPDLASKTPKFELPDMAVRTLALADKRLRTVLPELGKVKKYSNAKAHSELGIDYATAEQAITDSVRSLRDLKLI